MYYILKKVFFLPGTFFPEVSGPLRSGYSGKILDFSSVEEARRYLFKKGVDRQDSPQSLYRGGIHNSRHGEYTRPEYKIRKQTKKSSGIDSEMESPSKPWRDQ